MKRRYLRRSIEKVLIVLVILEMLFLLTLNDFDLSALPILVAIMISVAFNMYILHRWGRGLWYK